MSQQINYYLMSTKRIHILARIYLYISEWSLCNKINVLRVFFYLGVPTHIHTHTLIAHYKSYQQRCALPVALVRRSFEYKCSMYRQKTRSLKYICCSIYNKYIVYNSHSHNQECFGLGSDEGNRVLNIEMMYLLQRILI